MSLRLIFGRAGTGKSTLCLDEIRQEILSDPLGAPLILLVPEQSTHQMEMRLAHDPDLAGTLRAQVLSFRRMGWRIFSETGGGNQVVIGDIGKRMLLRRILLQKRSELRIFARSATRPGMADILAKAIAEFKIYRITPADLLNIQDNDQILTQKISELALLYQEFNEALGDEVRDPDDELTFVAERIPYSPTLQGAKIWVDGFKGFTPQELYILQSLLEVVDELTVTLPIDPDIIKRSPIGKSGIFRPGEEVYSDSWQTYKSLLSLAREVGVEVEKGIYLTEIHRFQAPELKHLEKFYNQFPTQVFNDQLQGIQLFSAINKRAEAVGVAREIRRIAREEGKQWKNIAVMTRDLAGYEAVIEQVFRAHDIPIFLDHKRPIVNHPLIELVLSALEVARTNWAYEPLFRCLKTGFFPINTDVIDRLENYCLEHGIRGEAWQSGEEWENIILWKVFDQEKTEQLKKEQEIINEARQSIFNILEPFISQLNPSLNSSNSSYSPANSEKSPQEADSGKADLDIQIPSQESNLTVLNITQAIYDLLIQLGVPEILTQWAEEARTRGNLAEARLQDQIWKALIDVFDEMIIGLGEEFIEIEEYSLVLTSGLENLKLGLIPPGYDQVLIGSLERSRNPEVEVLFLIGANEGILPAKPSTEGILDEIERQRLEDLGLTLAPKGKAQAYEEQYFIYSALTRATEKLYISFSLTDEEGKALTVSPVITRLKMLFPKLQEVYLGNLEEDLFLISHPYALLPEYAIRLMEYKEKSLPPLWSQVQQWFRENINMYPQAKLLESGVTSLNTEEKIPKPLARRLYGKRLLTSVTRLQKFASCPFAHYAQYGLKLKERSLFQLSRPDMGQFFHAVLYNFAKTIKERNLNWGDLSKEESWNIVSELAEIIAPTLQNGVFLRGARYRYITHKLKRTVHHAVRVLAEHARRGKFVPIQLEVRFGVEEDLPGIEIPLKDGSMLILQGQIDRIDGVVFDNTIYLRIIDYKSSEGQVNLNRIIYGLDLQLLAYLDAALHGAEVIIGTENRGLEVHPAGILYFPVLEPLIDSNKLLTKDQVEKERIKAVKVKGYLLAKQDVLKAMDEDLNKGSSDILGVKINKNGSIRKGSPVLTEEQFLLLRKHLYAFLQKTGEEILDGNIAISPYRQGKENACRFCSYKAVCHFDTYLPENTFRNLPTLADQEIWNRLQQLESSGVLEDVEKGEEESETELRWLEEENTTRRKRGEENE